MISEEDRCAATTYVFLITYKNVASDLVFSKNLQIIVVHDPCVEDDNENLYCFNN